HQDGFGQNLRCNSEAEPSSERSQEFSRQRSASIEIRRASFRIAIGFVNRCERDPFRASIQQNRSFELHRFGFTEMSIESHFCSSRMSQSGRISRSSPNVSIIRKK